MKLFSKNKNYELYEGSMLNMLDIIQPNSIDSIVTDTPYELNFMNRDWDNTGIAFQKETWEKCFKVLKSGGYLLAFGGSRTFHRIACAIEDAGFEIRDTIMWLYGSGFPKSFNIGKQTEAKVLFNDASGRSQKKLNGKKVNKSMWTHHWSYENDAENNDYSVLSTEKVIDVEYTTEQGKKWKGWGTQLKPSYEPIIVARKPIEKSIIDNVLKYGVGGINIDECRVELESDYQYKETNRKSRQENNVFDNNTCGFDSTNNHTASANINGRFPANTILTYDDTDFEEVCGGFPNSGSGNGKGVYSYKGVEYHNKDTSMFNGDKPQSPSNYNDSGSASRYFKNCQYTENDFYDVAQRYFYSAKASKSDRDEGLNSRKNTHATVKPCNLMRYLVRLVSPKGATILDCFNGSGSTGKAVMYENKENNKDYKYIGIELSEEYCEISKARIEYVCGTTDTISQIKENDSFSGQQISIEDVLRENEK